MTLGEFLAALTAVVLVAGVAITLIKSIVQSTVLAEFESVRRTQRQQDTMHDKRIARLERRMATLQMRLLGEADTFSGGDSE